MVTTSRREQEILILASDAHFRIAMKQALSSQGYRRLRALRFSDAFTGAVEAAPFLCVLCLDERGCELAMDVVGQLRQKSPRVNFIIITETASQTAELPIPDHDNFQVLSRPFVMLEFIAAVDRAV